MKTKILKWLKENYCLIILLTLGLVLSILALKELGFQYTINSDDLSYINSGITLFKKGILTMHGPISAQIMPGLPFLISIFCFIFGTGKLMIAALKIAYIIFLLITIIYSYKTLRLFANQYIASICSLLLLTPDFIWTNNLILTESPYLLFQTILIYYSLKLVIKQDKLSFVMIIISYICCLFLRPTIALFPIFLIIYLIIKKYNIKKIFKQSLILIVASVCALIPWTIRNYKQFEKIIPLSYGMGNPLLLGTYQGHNYPLDEELNYKIAIYDKLDKKMRYYLENPDIDTKWTKYYALKYDELVAKYRMQEWWKKDKIDMLKSYLIFKPKILLGTTFYWESIFNVSEHTIEIFHKLEFIICSVASLIIIFTKKYWKELIFLLGYYIYNIILYSYSFAYGRYALMLYPIRFIIIGLGITAIINYIKKGEINEKN